MSKNQFYELFQQWVRVVRRWFRRFSRTKAKSPIVLERHFGRSAALLRLERDTYGAIDTWRVIPRRSGTYDLLVNLDSFRKLKSQLDSQSDFRGQKPGSTPRQHPLTLEAEQLLLWQPNSDRTHLFWVEQVSRVPIAGQLHFRCIGIWAFDLEGFSPAWAGYERYAQSIVRTAVKKIVTFSDDDFEANVVSQDFWLLLIDASAKAYLGNSHKIGS